MKKHTTTFVLGFLIFIFTCIKLVDFTAVFNPEDTTAKDVSLKIHYENCTEGKFTDSKGETIFEPVDDYMSDTAHMPVEFSYVLGYNHYVYGQSGLRYQYRDHLYDDNGTNKGGTVQLTIDSVLQNKAYAALRDGKLSGSVVVLNAKNGEILAMAGRNETDYDIDAIRYTYIPSDASKEEKEKLTKQNADSSEVWSYYNTIPGFFLPPAVGDYKAPGSVFKILTAASAIINGMEDYTYEDTGTLTVDGEDIPNAAGGVYGLQNMQEALSTSTNTYFGSLALELGERNMNSIYKSFLVGNTIDLGFTRLNSSVTFNGSDYNLALLGFGQSMVAVSPLHMAMVGQSILNDGKMLKPTIIKALYDANGNEVYRNNEHEVITETVKPDVARKLKELLKGVTAYSDSKRALNKETEWLKAYTPDIYSKTGTAQITNYSNEYYSYYLCMTDDYVILASINDTSVSGSGYAYIAEKFLKELY